MRQRHFERRSGFGVVVLLLLWQAAGPVLLGQDKALTVEDMMKFRQVEDPVISKDGTWVAYEARPGRGDGAGYVASVDGATTYSVERGARAAISGDSAWAAFVLQPSFASQEKSRKDKPKPGMVLVNLSNGETTEFERVQRFAFSPDGKWLAYHRFKEEEKKGESAGGQEQEPEEEEGASQEEAADKPKKRKNAGTVLVLRRLADGQETEIEWVAGWSFDESSRYLAYAVAGEYGEENSLRVRLLNDSLAEEELAASADGIFDSLTWSEEKGHLAFLSAVADEKGEPGPAQLALWDGEGPARIAVDDSKTPQGWMVPLKNNDLTFSKDEERLFLGLRPRDEASGEEEPSEQSQEGANGEEGDERASAEEDSPDPYDVDAILKKREVDVWHWNDPRIKTHERNTYRQRSRATFGAVYHLESGKLVQLTDEEAPQLIPSENPNTAVVTSAIPYLREITWVGFNSDAYVVDLNSGQRKLAAKRISSPLELSPDGRYLAYFHVDNWWLYDSESDTKRILTAGMETPFYNEDHDYPSPRSGYGSAGWLEDSSAILIYDKYDIWKFPAQQDNRDAECLTQERGRQEERVFRVVRTDREEDFIPVEATLLLSSYHDKRKNDGWYQLDLPSGQLSVLLEEPKKFDFVAKAEEADRLLYTREDYGEFPNLWVASPDFSDARRVSDLNPQISEFAWGSSELVEWNSLDGIPLQGVLIKPGNYEPGKRYPVLVYFYRFFSQRLHEFNEVVINHRPNFPFYASNGYAVFLPDIRFEVGRPGFSATKCLVPGVQKLIEMGIADPDAVGLHGHSWSGYQTAFVVTQTDIFAAAVAGAPVTNMTSAYGGIRWGSGLSRQFQYEQSQSRIGASLWEDLPAYLENSPVFYADRINTPLLIQFGDEDGAVPWTQGIELYMALRRLEKPSVFLQYRGEPHHLQKYANKLDYTLKMKEFFDHFLKGAPAPDWWTTGVEYTEAEPATNDRR
ncbi:MAG TPA: prolyl oligopeptidase family serine peptidase [Acidobacteriota bacterium]|nr:prolyl oligopeptidase family serine peptidase [Acidobacteriota bacterium]